MHSDRTQIESRLRQSRAAGVMAPPSPISIDPAALPDRASPRRGIDARPLMVVCFVGLVAASIVVFGRRAAPGPSASEAVALSFEAIPQGGADLTRRFIAPVRRELQSVAMQTRRASEAFRGGLQQWR